MRIVQRHLGVTVLAGALAACGAPGLEEAVLGSWGAPDGDRFTFARGGRVEFGNRYASFEGKYRIVGDSIVEMSLRDPFGGETERMRFRMRVADGALELCPPEGPGGACEWWPRMRE